MRNTKSLSAFLMLCSTLFYACQKDEKNSTLSAKSYGPGVYISCEGPFGSGSGTISYLNRVTASVENDIFQEANKRPAGNIVQSIEIFNGKGYIVVNNANKTEVVNATDFVSSGIISGLNAPRYFLGITSSKGYITQWDGGASPGTIAVIDLNSNSISKTITAGTGPERMLRIGNEVYVVNAGGFTKDSTVTILDASGDSVIASVQVGYNPNSIQEDINGNVWVLCGGINDWVNPANNTPGKLVKINPATHAVTATIDFSSVSLHPSDLVINNTKDKLYYSYNEGVYVFDITAAILAPSALVVHSFYEIGIDPLSNLLYGADAKDYSSPGWIYRHKLTDGSVSDSFRVGVIPGGFYFRQ